jgi:hypothetical protein
MIRRLLHALSPRRRRIIKIRALALQPLPGDLCPKCGRRSVVMLRDWRSVGCRSCGWTGGPEYWRRDR